MRIGMVTTFYPPHNFGGDGIFVHRLANALARRDHEVHVVYDLDAFALLSDHKPRRSYPNYPKVVLHPLTSKGAGPLDMMVSHQLGRPFLKAKQLRTILEKSDFDVVHFHNVSLMGGPQILGYGDAIRLCTIHDYWFVCPMHVLWRFDRESCTRRTCLACTVAGGRPPQLWRYNGKIGSAQRDIDAFIGPSKSTAEIHASNGFHAPIRHIPHFIPDDEAREMLEGTDTFNHPRPYFLYVGRLEKLKGVQNLIQILRSYREADLLIAGDGTYASKLREMAAGLPHVRFLGQVERENLPALYRGAIATLVPSLCYESFVWPTLESLVVSTPVIVNDKGALPEIVHQTGGGLVYQEAHELIEAMEILRTQPELRQKLGARGFEGYTKHYTEEHHLQSYFNLIAELQGQHERQGVR